MSFLENNAKQIAAILCTASAFPVVSTIYAMEAQPVMTGEKEVGEAAEDYAAEIGGSTYFVEESARTASIQVDFTNTLKEKVAESVEEVLEAEAEAAAEEEAVEEQDLIAAEEIYVAPVVEEAQPEAVVETPVVEEVVQTPVVEEVVQTPVVEEVVQTPVVEEVVQTPVVNDPQAALNQSIADAAIGLVGVTNGWQCTQVATQALNNAGFPANVVWPSQYLQYGYVTDTPTAGNLLYYNNGGNGLDHIAVYIGDGQAVHGNYDGQTVIAGANLPTMAPPIYIQVTM